jgi:hypothetical protein
MIPNWRGQACRPSSLLLVLHWQATHGAVLLRHETQAGSISVSEADAPSLGTASCVRAAARVSPCHFRLPPRARLLVGPELKHARQRTFSPIAHRSMSRFLGHHSTIDEHEAGPISSFPKRMLNAGTTLIDERRPRHRIGEAPALSQDSKVPRKPVWETRRT